MENCCGLLTVKKEPVPLKSIDAQLEVRDHVATLVSTLVYENKEDKPLEAVFVFPLPGDAAVCHFSAQIGQTHVVAEVKEKQQAREEYDDALSSGQQAFLLEESNESPDIFSLRVGSLPPGESASIRLEYVTELAVQADDGLRFCLPAVLNPRYQPQGSEAPSVQVTSVPASLVPYSLSFSARVSSSRPVSKVESNCSLEPLQYLNSDQTQATVKLTAGHKFDRDVEVLIYYKDAHQPSAVVEAGQASATPGSLMGDPVVMVSLYPEFPQSVMSSFASCGEFVFLMDRSGSMDCPMNNSTQQGTRISSARDTLLLLLKSLPMGCYFNIYSFGSSFEHIFPTSVEYSEKTMKKALKKVKKMEANLGGTEILNPLKHIFSQSCLSKHPRQLFVFTDGEVGNTIQVTELVKKNAGSHRYFSFGIGEGASSALINGMAKEGGGHAQFITGTDKMQPKVMQSLMFALQPVVADISVSWDLPKGVSATILSPPITKMFQGQRSLIYAQLKGQNTAAAEGIVTVKYCLADHSSQNQLHFNLKPVEDTGLTVHRLAARTGIRSLESKEGIHDKKVKKKVVELSVQSGVSSSFTAFIAVNKDSGKVVEGPLVRGNISTPYLGAPSRNSPVTLRHRIMLKLGMASSAPAHHYMAMVAPPRHVKLGMASSAATHHYMAMVAPPKHVPDDLSLGPLHGVRDDLSLRALHVATCCASFEPLQKRMASSAPTHPPFKSDGLDLQSLKPQKDSLLQLVCLQKASGCWLLDADLAAVLGKTREEMEKLKPESVNSEVWASILALIWLHGFKMDAKGEWELLAMKTGAWIKAQNAACVPQCVEAGNTLLGCSVKKEALGL